MKVDPVVRSETKVIASGVGIMCLLMLAVFAFLKRLDYTVLLGTALGFAAAVGNFFLMALSVQKSAEKMNGVKLPEKEESEDNRDEENAPLSDEAKSAKKYMQVSYTFRMFMLVIVAILAVTLPFFSAVPCLIVLLFPRIVVFFVQLIRNKKEATGT